MERFRQRIMKDLLELEEAAALKVKPKKIISEEGNVKTIDCEGDLAVVGFYLVMCTGPATGIGNIGSCLGWQILEVPILRNRTLNDV